MRIIPAIDIIEGKCVRLTKGNYSTTKIYNENPLEVAKQFEDAGIKYLHLVDLDGAKAKHIVNYKILERLANKTNLKIDFGGGIKTEEDLHVAFNSGAKQITAGSIAVSNPFIFEQWLLKFGSTKIILGADCLDGKIAIHGWQKTSNSSIVPFIKSYQKKGVQYVVCTDIDKDGMLQGPSFDLYREIINTCTNLSNNQSIKLVASGGVTQIDDIQKLNDIGCEGVIIGKALYENKISLNQLEAYM